ncbi:transcription factor DIVARICATA-like [Gastrolobium bilobum]|uniref:transcription factor DIVARICATA-like n=1 Tax=Gastrolobium bilobum TaxID=150636 RepID=UPI002AAFCE77|nr:transcription factor DIVARICATA-like [Gastrolobium bilobum]
MKWEMEILPPAPYIHNPNNTNWFLEDHRNTKWTPAENKLFENALAVYDKDTPDRWHKVAEMIPGKTVGDVMKQYKELEADISNIEAGLIPVPGYSTTTSPFTLDWVNTPGYDDGFKGLTAKRSSSGRPPDQERKKGVPWTEEEHKLFLLGLKKYGKGDWRNISRNFVMTRTPTQVASHAQKYFIRQLSGGKDKRRASIHDITTVNLTETTRTTTPSEDSKRSTSPQHSMMLSHQQPNSTAATSGVHFQWNNQPNEGVAMALNPSHEQVFMSPYGLNPYGFKMQCQNLHRSPLHESSYLVPQTQNMVFQMQSSQHYSHA